MDGMMKMAAVRERQMKAVVEGEKHRGKDTTDLGKVMLMAINRKDPDYLHSFIQVGTYI